MSSLPPAAGFNLQRHAAACPKLRAALPQTRHPSQATLVMFSTIYGNQQPPQRKLAAASSGSIVAATTQWLVCTSLHRLLHQAMQKSLHHYILYSMIATMHDDAHTALFMIVC
jgi:hypothetical protein